MEVTGSWINRFRFCHNLKLSFQSLLDSIICFWWEVSYHLYIVLLYVMCFVFSKCFEDFSFIYYYIWFDLYFFCLNLLWFMDLYANIFQQMGEIFSHFFFRYFFLPYSYYPPFLGPIIFIIDRLYFPIVSWGSIHF